MNTQESVGHQALKYRIVVKESAGIILTILLTFVSGIALTSYNFGNTALFIGIIFLIVFILQFLLIVIPAYLEYYNLRYTISQDSITLQRGVFTVEIKTIPFQKIVNAGFTQTVLQRLFMVGSVTLDQENERFLWESVDAKTAVIVLDLVAQKSNIQPIKITT